MELCDELGGVHEILGWLPGRPNIVVSRPLHVILQLPISSPRVEYMFNFPLRFGGVIDDYRVRIWRLLACSWRPISIE